MTTQSTNLEIDLQKLMDWLREQAKCEADSSHKWAEFHFRHQQHRAELVSKYRHGMSAAYLDVLSNIEHGAFYKVKK